MVEPQNEDTPLRRLGVQHYDENQLKNFNRHLNQPNLTIPPQAVSRHLTLRGALGPPGSTLKSEKFCHSGFCRNGFSLLWGLTLTTDFTPAWDLIFTYLAPGL